MLQPDQVKDSLHAYQISKRGNSLRVMAEAVRWGKRGARVNTISPGIIVTPLAKDELSGPRGEGYRRMINISAAGRAGTRMRWQPSPLSCWGQMARSSPAAISSWMAESRPPTGSANSPSDAGDADAAYSRKKVIAATAIKSSRCACSSS